MRKKGGKEKKKRKQSGANRIEKIQNGGETFNLRCFVHPVRALEITPVDRTRVSCPSLARD